MTKVTMDYIVEKGPWTVLQHFNQYIYLVTVTCNQQSISEWLGKISFTNISIGQKARTTDMPFSGLVKNRHMLYCRCYTVSKSHTHIYISNCLVNKHFHTDNIYFDTSNTKAWCISVFSSRFRYFRGLPQVFQYGSWPGPIWTFALTHNTSARRYGIWAVGLLSLSIHIENCRNHSYPH